MRQDIRIAWLRKRHGLSEARARLVAALAFGG